MKGSGRTAASGAAGGIVPAAAVAALVSAAGRGRRAAKASGAAPEAIVHLVVVATDVAVADPAVAAKGADQAAIGGRIVHRPLRQCRPRG